MTDNEDLPALPEGYFWRVTDGPLGVCFPYVQLRKKTWLGSYEVDALFQSHTKFASVGAEVQYLCRRILQLRAERARGFNERKKWSGDYGRS